VKPKFPIYATKGSTIGKCEIMIIWLDSSLTMIISVDASNKCMEAVASNSLKGPSPLFKETSSLNGKKSRVPFFTFHLEGKVKFRGPGNVRAQLRRRAIKEIGETNSVEEVSWKRERKRDGVK